MRGGSRLAREFARRPPAAGFWSPEELPMHITLKELIAFNNVYKEKELEHFGQEIFVMAQKRREEVGEAEAAEAAAAT